MRLITIIILFVCCQTMAYAQGSTQPQAADLPPGTDIWLFDLSLNSDKPALSNGKNITERTGYDNQPAFSPNGKQILYSSMRNGQTDIFKYNITTQENTRITNTEDSEYSPIVMPDKTHFSCVRVEKDSILRIWKYSMQGEPLTPLLKKVKQVGYHTWLGANNFALFIVGKNGVPNSLHTASFGDKASKKVFDGVGRCLQKIPGKSALSFVVQQSQDEKLRGMIVELNIYTHDLNNIIPALEGSEDFVWTPNGWILMAQGNKLYKFNPKRDVDWILVHSFSNLEGISRIAINKEGTSIALVAQD